MSHRVHGSVLVSGVFNSMANWPSLAAGCKVNGRGWTVWIGKTKQLAAVTQDWLVQSLAISLDGKRLATVSYGSQAILVDLPGLENPVVLAGHTDDVKSIAFSPNGWTVATGSWDGTVKLWDVETARCTSTLHLDGTARSVSTVAFSPDGETIAAGCGTIDQRSAQHCSAVTCWDIATGKQTVSLPHNDYVTSLVFSPDQRTLFSERSRWRCSTVGLSYGSKNSQRFHMPGRSKKSRFPESDAKLLGNRRPRTRMCDSIVESGSLLLAKFPQRRPLPLMPTATTNAIKANSAKDCVKLYIHSHPVSRVDSLL